jgi:hypothetical protein
MVIVRNCFTAKPGCAARLAGILHRAFTAGPIPKFRVLTDWAGGMNRVIVEFEAEHVAEAEKMIQQYRASAAFHEIAAGYTDLWLTGRREILRIVE